jgi:hypothetical protein
MTAARGGAWALLFQIDDNFTIDPFQGAVISVKRHYSDRSALRLGLGLAFDMDEISSTISEMDTVKATSKSDGSSQFFRVDLQYVRYANPTAPVKLLFGGGPLVSFSNSDDERTTGTGSDTVESTAWVAGITGLVGVEWFAASRISLHAEYGMELTYRHSTAKSTNSAQRTSEQTRKDGDFRSRGVLFGLSAYF